MADASASLPSPVQQDRKNQLESDRLRAERSGGASRPTGQRSKAAQWIGNAARGAALAGMMAIPGAGGGGGGARPQSGGFDSDPSAEMAGGGGAAANVGKEKENKAEEAVSKGLDTLSNAPDPRIKAAAMAAKAVGADKMLAKNKNVQSAAELLAAAQSGDLKAAIRAGGKNWKNNVLWPTFVANVFVEPLSAFAFTFVCIQIYCMGSFMLGDILEPPSTNEYVAIAILSCCQVIIILGILLLSYVVFCLVNPICAVDVFGSAIAKSLLEPVGIKF